MKKQSYNFRLIRKGSSKVMVMGLHLFVLEIQEILETTAVVRHLGAKVLMGMMDFILESHGNLSDPLPINLLAQSLE